MSRSATAAALLLLLALLALATPTARAFSFADEPPHCENCMDGMPMDGCPKPSLCGFKPFLCVDCMDGMAMPKCPHPEWCKDVDCAKADCMDEMPMPTCPDPGTCGFKPIPCYGCVPGLSRASCPEPAWCFNNMTTPPCMNCMEGMAMPYCPNATACMAPGPVPPPPAPSGLQCIDCMAGMAMPQCPFPELCDLSTSCTMNMYFGVDSGFCVFLKQWRVSDAAQWAAAFFGILFLCFLREALTVWRVHQNMSQRQNDRLRRMYARDPVAARRVGVDVRSVTSVSAPQEPTSSVSLGSSKYPGVQRSEPLLHNASGVASESGAVSSFPVVLRSLPAPHSETLLLLLESIYYLLSLVLAYLLMLLIMTYNVQICLLVVCGCAFAHFTCNLLYQRLVRRQSVATVRALTVEFQRAQREGGAVQQGDEADKIIAYAPPTGGDHCCDDIDFGEDI